MNKVKTEDAADYKVIKSTNDDQIISQAIAIISNRLVQFGYSFHSVTDTKSYCVLKLAEQEREEFVVLFLNNQHQLIECRTMFCGTIDSCSVHPREVAKVALELNAAAIIFAHNHPSKICTPSMSDKSITDKLRDGLKLFDIRVLDHIIVGGVDTYSFAENGLI